MNNKQLLSKLMLAFVLTVGVMTTWIIVISWATSVMSFQREYAYETLIYTPEGEPIVQAEAQRFSHSYQGLDGQTREFTSEAMWLSAASVSGVDDSRWPKPPKYWNSRMAPFSDGGSPPTFWYFVHNGRRQGAGYFVGYDSVSKQIVGYLDRKGFHEAISSSTKDHFDVPLENSNDLSNYLASSQGVYYYNAIYEPQYFNSTSRVFPGWRVYLIDAGRVVEVDLRRRNSPPKTLIEADGLLSVAILKGVDWKRTQADPLAWSAITPAENDDDDPQEDLLIASTADQIIIYDPLTNETTTLDRPDDLKSKPLQVYRAKTGDFILQNSSYNPERGNPTLSYTMSADGAIKNRIDVQLNHGNRSSPQSVSLYASAVVPFPLASITAAFGLMPLNEISRDKTLTYPQALAKSLSDLWTFLAITFIVGGLLAWRCYVRQRRFADETILPWIVLVFLLGVPGYIAYRLHRHWPVRLLCPACNMPSPRDRQDCVDCGAEWPAPKDQSIEVFA